MTAQPQSLPITGEWAHRSWRWATLFVLCTSALMLSGCSSDGTGGTTTPAPAGGLPAGDETVANAPRALDCSRALTISIAADSRGVFIDDGRAPGERAGALERGDTVISVDEPLRLVVTSDNPAMLRPGGSTIPETTLPAGEPTALCLTYRSEGRYAIELDDRVVAFVQVNAVIPDAQQ